MTMTDEIRRVQGLSEPTNITGDDKTVRVYMFKKLRRREIHRVQYQLISPVLRLIQGVIETMQSAQGEGKKFSLGDLEKGDIDFQNFDVSPFAKLIDEIGFDRYWEIATAVLDNVVVDNRALGPLEDSEYYDDKPIEMLRAIAAGVSINFPFVRGVLLRAKKKFDFKAGGKTKEEGSEDRDEGGSNP